MRKIILFAWGSPQVTKSRCGVSHTTQDMTKEIFTHVNFNYFHTDMEIYGWSKSYDRLYVHLSLHIALHQTAAARLQ